MNAPAPRILRLVFYLPHDHHALAPVVSRALDTYLHAVGAGPETLGKWCDTEGEGDWFPLTGSGWEVVRSWLRPGEHRFVEDWDAETFLHRNKKGFETCVSLAGATPDTHGYAFNYLARLPWRTPRETVSTVSFSLPTKFLDEQGPEGVKSLALELAAGLPFTSGHAGLAFHPPNSSRQVMRTLREYLFRYPGLDLPTPGITDTLGTRVDGVHWLNFLGPSVLGEVGGASGLRARLHSPETTVRELENERVLVTLGKQPEAGDLAHGHDLPAYRELARVLEPWLAEAPNHSPWSGYSEEATRRWWRRFLD
jgi:hypothetical protein